MGRATTIEPRLLSESLPDGTRPASLDLGVPGTRGKPEPTTEYFTRYPVRFGDDRCGLPFGKQLEFCPVGHGVRENQFSIVSRSRYNIGQ